MSSALRDDGGVTFPRCWDASSPLRGSTLVPFSFRDRLSSPSMITLLAVHALLHLREYSVPIRMLSHFAFLPMMGETHLSSLHST
jgi:hypothetical protein